VAEAQSDDPSLVAFHQGVKGRGFSLTAVFHEFGVAELSHKGSGFVRQDFAAIVPGKPGVGPEKVLPGPGKNL
jgi:hypothetical protein